jgi:hypothetical protein
MDNQFAGISFGYDANKVYKYRNANRCKIVNNVFYYSSPNVHAMVKQTGKITHVDARILHRLSNMHTHIKWWAPNAPTKTGSFSGSGMPFPNEKIAYDNTPNQGFSLLTGLTFGVDLQFPNSYYTQLGRKYVPPQLKYQMCDSQGNNCSPIYKIKLGEGIPFRYQSFPPQRNWNIGPMFYCNPNVVVTTQAKRLVANAYPKDGVQPPNFWGTISPN